MAAHTHGGHREQRTAENRRRLWLVLVLTSIYLVAEIVGGILTNSLALLSDAGHMLTDIASLLLALLAIWFALRPATPRKTYGYYRLEILAALINGIVLLGVSAIIIIEAISRIHHPPVVHGLGVFIVALGGLGINIAGAYLLRQGHAHSLNVRAAFYHVLADALGSLGAVASGALIYFFGWYLADPVIAIGIAILVMISAWVLLREAVDILLEATPAHIDAEGVRAAILQLPGVDGVHDLHIWTITSGMYSLSCHVVVTPNQFSTDTLEAIRALLHEHCDIPHLTIQLETADFAAEEDVHL